MFAKKTFTFNESQFELQLSFLTGFEKILGYKFNNIKELETFLTEPRLKTSINLMLHYLKLNPKFGMPINPVIHSQMTDFANSAGLTPQNLQLTWFYLLHLISYKKIKGSGYTLLANEKERTLKLLAAHFPGKIEQDRQQYHQGLVFKASSALVFLAATAVALTLYFLFTSAVAHLMLVAGILAVGAFVLLAVWALFTKGQAYCEAAQPSGLAFETFHFSPQLEQKQANPALYLPCQKVEATEVFPSDVSEVRGP